MIIRKQYKRILDQVILALGALALLLIVSGAANHIVT